MDHPNTAVAALEPVERHGGTTTGQPTEMKWPKIKMSKYSEAKYRLSKMHEHEQAERQRRLFEELSLPDQPDDEHQPGHDDV